MGFRQWLHNKTKPKSNGRLTDIDREKALSARRLEHAVKQKEKEMALMERILNMETQINPKESAMDTLVKMLIPVLMSKVAGEKKIQTPQLTEAGKVFSDEEIKHILNSNPKLKEFGSKFSDEEIKEYVIQQIPNISKDSIDRLIVQVRA